MPTIVGRFGDNGPDYTSGRSIDLGGCVLRLGDVSRLRSAGQLAVTYLGLA